MTTNEIRSLLEKIQVHYRGFEITAAVIDEWYRLIGFLGYQEAINKLDDYLLMEDGNRNAPRIQWFRKSKIAKQQEEEYVSKAYFDRLDSRGRLTDAEGRMYAFPDKPDEIYHINSSGRICNSKGEVVF